MTTIAPRRVALMRLGARVVGSGMQEQLDEMQAQLDGVIEAVESIREQVRSPREELMLRIGLSLGHFEEAVATGDRFRAQAHAAKIAEAYDKLAADEPRGVAGAQASRRG